MVRSKPAAVGRSLPLPFSVVSSLASLSKTSTSSPLPTQTLPVAGSGSTKNTDAAGSSAVAVTAKEPVSTRRSCPPVTCGGPGGLVRGVDAEQGPAVEGEGALDRAGGDLQLGEGGALRDQDGRGVGALAHAGDRGAGQPHTLRGRVAVLGGADSPQRVVEHDPVSGDRCDDLADHPGGQGAGGAGGLGDVAEDLAVLRVEDVQTLLGHVRGVDDVVRTDVQLPRVGVQQQVQRPTAAVNSADLA